MIKKLLVVVIIMDDHATLLYIYKLFYLNRLDILTKEFLIDQLIQATFSAVT